MIAPVERAQQSFTDRERQGSDDNKADSVCNRNQHWNKG